MVIIETSVFTRCIQELMSDDEYRDLQNTLISRPDAGSLIPGSGGLPKVRWKIGGKGKRGGVRLIYYWYRSDAQLWMLVAYSKTTQENLTSK